MKKLTETSLLTPKGQITIPVRIRKALGLETGAKVEFVRDGLRVYLRSSTSVSNPFVKYVGALKGHSRSKHQINHWLADLREDDCGLGRRSVRFC